MSKTQVTIHKSNKAEVIVKAFGKGKPLVLKAEADARYELADVSKAQKGAIEGVKFKRVGKSLHIVLDQDDSASLVIEDYYDVHSEGTHAIVGKADNGALYEYVTPAGAVSELQVDSAAVTGSLGTQTVNLPVSMGGTGGNGWGATALWGALGAGAVVAAVGKKDASATDLQIKGQVNAGPVHAGITVYVYDEQGQLLGKTDADEKGQWRITATGRADYKGAVLVVAVDNNAAESNFLDEVTAQNKSIDTTLRAMAVQTEQNISNDGNIRVLTVNITPVSELAVRKAGVIEDKAPAASLITETNSQVAKALGVPDLDITGEVITTISSDFKAGDGLSSAEKYGLLLTKLSGLDKVNNGNIDTSLKQLVEALDQPSSTDSQVLLEQGRQEALKAVQENVTGAVFADNTGANRQLLGEVLISSQRLDENGHLVIVGTAMPGSIVTVTTAEGTQQVQVDAEGNFSMTTTQKQNQFNVPLSVQTTDGMGQLATNTIALKPQVTDANSITAESVATLLPSQVSGLTLQAIAGMTAQEIAALSPAAFAALSPEQLAALTLNNVSGLSAEAINGLSAEQMAALSPDVSNLLNEMKAPVIGTAELAAMTAEELSALTAAQVARLSDDVVASLTAAQIAALSPAGFSGLSPDDLASLSSAAVGGITAAQAAGLDAGELGALGANVANLGGAALSALTPAQFAALTPAQLSALSQDDVAALSDAVIASLTAGQIGALSASGIAGLSGTDLANLSGDAVSGLTAEQIAGMGPGDLAALGANIANLSGSAMGAISPAQFSALSAAQLAALGLR